MKKILIIISLLAALTSCVKEFNFKDNVGEGEDVYLDIDFSFNAPAEIVTKSVLNVYEENKVNNIVIFVFNSQGKKIYARWLDHSDLKSSENNLTDDSWFISNTATESSKTYGGARIKVAAGSNYNIYVLANFDDSFMKASPEYIQSRINSEEELENFTLELSQAVISRSSYFPMSGSIKNVNVTNNQNINQNKQYNPTSKPTSVRIPLTRIDALIEVVFKTGDRPDPLGMIANNFSPLRWRIVNVPRTAYAIGRDSGDAVNVPARELSAQEYEQYSKEFFDTDWQNFENFTVAADGKDEAGFSFYMFESRQTPKTPDLSDYQDRSRQVKLSSRLNKTVPVKYIDAFGNDISKEVKVFENANDFSTYLLVTGKVELDINHPDIDERYSATDVQYMIHLGDWNRISAAADYKNDGYSGMSDYSIKRNTKYHYTVIVNSVNSIYVEVHQSGLGEDGTDIENQPGAIGVMTNLKEEPQTVDAHFSSRTVAFHAANYIKRNTDSEDHSKYYYYPITDQLTWYVITPFSEGQPVMNGGVEDASGLDYKWIKFRLNKTDDNGVYTANRRAYCTPDRVFAESGTLRTAAQNKAPNDINGGLAGYHNDGLMDVSYLVKFLKEQIQLYCNYLNGITPNNESLFDNPGRFQKNGTINEESDAPKISLTAFFDEYYYQQHPITGEVSQTLWKQFTNQPQRKMLIFSKLLSSADLESRIIESAMCLSQESIQTVYSVDAAMTGLKTAWGTEVWDENERDANGDFTAWRYGSPTPTGNYTIKVTDAKRGNYSKYNGRFNSMKEFGLWTGNGATGGSFKSNQNWSSYMSYEQPNDETDLNGSHKYHQYSCMERNRDENGDGVIQESEIKWYLAADQQQIGLVLGKTALTSQARLYNRSVTERNNSESTTWNQHLFSSTSYDLSNSNNPRVLWSEEGLSTSSYLDDYIWKENTKWTVRCLRNLGVDDSVSSSTFADTGENKIPQDYLLYDTSDNTFNMKYLNARSRRQYSSHELSFHCELDVENNVYDMFQIGPDITFAAETMFTENFVNVSGATINDFDIPEKNRCPEGYRYPNQTELAIMINYQTEGSFSGNYLSRTATTIGRFAPYFGYKTRSAKSNMGGYSIYNGTDLTIGGHKCKKVRCVRDVRQ